MRFLQNINWNWSLKIGLLMALIFFIENPELTVLFVPKGRNEVAQEADLVRRSYWDVACFDAKIRTQVAFQVFPSSETFRSPYVLAEERQWTLPTDFSDTMHIFRSTHKKACGIHNFYRIDLKFGE